MTTEDALKQLEATGKIDTLGVVNPGSLIDLFNHRLEKKREKDFNNKVQGMNKYYIKLIVDTLTQRQNGVKTPIYKSTSQIFT